MKYKMNTINKGCVNVFSKKCSKSYRNLTESNIAKLVELGFADENQLNKQFKICDSCRLQLAKRTALSSSDDLSSSEEEDVCMEEETIEASASATSIQSTDSNMNIPSQESLEATSATSIESTNSNLNVSSKETLEATSATSIETTDSNVPEYIQKVNIDIFNESISSILVAPIDKTKISSTKYVTKKYHEIVNSIRQNIFALNKEAKLDENRTGEFYEIIEQLKEKFTSEGTTRAEQFQLLTVLPKSWTAETIKNTFDTTLYTATEAKQLLNKSGVHSTIGPRATTGLDENIKHAVMQFYEDDETSRAMPGQRDCVTIRKDGKRQAVQKRLMTTTLREAYNRFQELNTEIQIGFSSFAKLRPKNCKLLTSSGTHNVCVCTIHENVNLITHSLKKYGLSNELKVFTDSLTCENATVDCFLRRCENCIDTTSLEKKLLEEMDEKFVDEIIFEQWVTTDRCDIETFTKQKEEFVSYFIQKLEKLIPHDLIKKEQSTFLKNKKK